MEVGTVCDICKRNDFLPFKCSHCDKTVCLEHKTDHGNECPLQNTKFQKEHLNVETQSSLKNQCGYCKKSCLKLELVECPKCRTSNCLLHRHQVQHDCPDIAKDKESLHKDKADRSIIVQEALDKLKARTTRECHASTVAPNPISSDDRKKLELQRKIRLMKIKQSARGPPNILNEDKIYFEVKFLHEPQSPLSDPSKDGSTVRIFTTPKHTIGRMVDWTADELSIKNKNHLVGESQLVFKMQAPDSTQLVTLNNQLTFSHHLSNQILGNGDEIILTFDIE